MAELTEAELNGLVKATGSTESEIRETYADLLKRFPKGFLTEQEFVDRFHESYLFGDNKRLYTAKHLFSIADRNNSGTVDIYEYFLTMASLSSEDPQIVIKCLFKLCDANQDGMLSQQEIVDVLYSFDVVSRREHGDVDEEKVVDRLQQIKDSVSRAFQDRTEVSEREFYDVVEKNEDIQSLGMRLKTLFLLGMVMDESDYD